MAKKRVYGEGSITQRKDGRWQISVPGLDGQRRYAYADTPKEAEKVRRKLLSEVEQGKVPASKQPFQEHVKEWLEMKRKSQDYKPNTYLGTVYTFNAHFIPAFGHIPLSKLSPSHIQKFYSKLLDQSLSPNTIRRYHQKLNVCLKSAIKQGKIDSNPCERVELPKRKKSKNNHLNQEDAHRLLKAIQKHKLLSTLIPLALVTEAREGELLALTWDDVDLEQGTISITKTLTQEMAGEESEKRILWGIVPPKSESGIREISLPDFAISMLRKHKTAQFKKQLASGVPGTKNLVFPGPKGEYTRPSNVRQCFKRLVTRLNLDITFHDLRHTGATLLLESGVSPLVVQERLGHSDIKITLGIYGHVTPRMRNQAVGTLDTLFSDQKDTEAI